jgi:hypothetical protein
MSFPYNPDTHVSTEIEIGSKRGKRETGSGVEAILVLLLRIIVLIMKGTLTGLRVPLGTIRLSSSTPVGETSPD